MPGVLHCCLAHQAHRGAPLARVLLCRSVYQALKGAPWMGSSLVWHIQSLKGAPWVGSYCVVQCIRHLMGQPLHCSAASAGLWGETGYGIGSTRYVRLSCITLLPWVPGFPPRAFPTPVSSLTSPPIHLSAVTNPSPRPGIAPQSLKSGSQSVHLPGDLHPCPGYVWLWQGLSDFHSI